MTDNISNYMRDNEENFIEKFQEEDLKEYENIWDDKKIFTLHLRARQKRSCEEGHNKRRETMSEMITVYCDRIPIRIDSEELEIIKLMVKEVGGEKKLSDVRIVIDNLISQGYTKGRAFALVFEARRLLCEGH